MEKSGRLNKNSKLQCPKEVLNSPSMIKDAHNKILPDNFWDH
jgi:hypothetical protein